MKIKTMNLSFYITFAFSICTLFLLTYINGQEPLVDQYIKTELGPNETIWGLAEKYANKHDMSTWEFVSWVEENNKIDADRVAVGTKILLPVVKQQVNDDFMVVADGDRKIND